MASRVKEPLAEPTYAQTRAILFATGYDIRPAGLNRGQVSDMLDKGFNGSADDRAEVFMEIATLPGAVKTEIPGNGFDVTKTKAHRNGLQAVPDPEPPTEEQPTIPVRQRKQPEPKPEPEADPRNVRARLARRGYYQIRHDVSHAAITIPKAMADKVPADVFFVAEVTDEGILLRAIREDDIPAAPTRSDKPDWMRS